MIAACYRITHSGWMGYTLTYPRIFLIVRWSSSMHVARIIPSRWSSGWYDIKTKRSFLMISLICSVVSPSTLDSPVMISLAHCVLVCDMIMTVLLVENERGECVRYWISKQYKDDDNPEEQGGSDVFHVVCSFFVEKPMIHLSRCKVLLNTWII